MPQDFILSEVTKSDLKIIQINRKYKPVKQKYGLFLRGERISQKKYLPDLQALMREKYTQLHCATFTRWELGYIDPPINIVSFWAECLDLKLNINIYSPDRRLIGANWKDQLVLLRKDDRVSLEVVAKQVGVQRALIAQWEQNPTNKYPNEPELKDWAIALGVEAEFVFERKST